MIYFQAKRGHPMKTDRVFVLLLVVLLPLTGCFDDAVGEADAQEDTSSGTTVINNYYNNTTQTTTQQPTYYSSGGIVNKSWDEYGVNTLGQINSSHPSIGIATLDTAQDYNLTECILKGGFENGEEVAWLTLSSSSQRLRPVCSIDLTTINTSAGQALVIHEWTNFVMKSVCDGVEVNSYSSLFADGRIVSGSALDCTHTLSYSMTYSSSEDLIVWSILYSIQPTIVV
jgi:hypothetical protein